MTGGETRSTARGPRRGYQDASLGVGAAASLAGIALVAGLVPALRWGWLPAVAVLTVCWLLRERRRIRAADDPTPLGATPLRAGVILALVVLPAAVFTAVAVRGVASVLVAYPATHWAVGIILGGTVLLGFVGSARARGPVALLLLLGALFSAVSGTRFEAQAVHARGWAHSAAIHGIHPFQTTAIIIDGYGPFDIPINDYVEPDGHRGYKPQAFADAVQRALRDIARIHFAEGPARAAMAFGQAEVETHVEPAVAEQLDRDPDGAEHPRFVVTSGTFGQRSSVSFVCPGRRDDPRGPQADNIMNRMCPDKYAAEASAGLGVTGRWAGYSEARGQPRVGLGPALGWTRSDDEVGRQVVRDEIVIVGILAIVWLSATSLIAGGRAALQLRSLAGMVVLGALGVVLVASLQGSAWSMTLSAVETSIHAPGDASILLLWLPALALLAGQPAFERFAGPPRLTVSARPAGRIALALVLTATVATAAHLSSLGWIRPAFWTSLDHALPLEMFVRSLAEGWGEPFGLSVLEVEGIVASALAIVLLGLGAGSVLAGAGVARVVGPSDKPWAARAVGALAVAGIACALIVSRKTEGGAALVPGAIGLTVLSSSCMAVACRPGKLGRVLHVGWVALAIALVWLSAASMPGHPFVVLCTVVGLLAALASLAFVPSPRSGSPPG